MASTSTQKEPSASRGETGEPALKAAGLAPDRYKFHSARHYAVSSMLRDGVPIPEVADYIGDHIDTVTAVYAHFLRDAPRTAKAELDKALGLLDEGGDEELPAP